MLTVRLARPAWVALIDDDGRAMRPVVERGRSLAYQVCGQRSVTVRVISRIDVTHVHLQVTIP